MAENSNTNPATAGNQTITSSTGDDSLTGGFGNDTINGQGGDDILHGDTGVPGSWHYETYDYNFGSGAGQAFDIENGTRTASGYVSDFNEGGLTNTIRGTTGNPEDFGVIYTSTLNVTTGGTYRLTTASDDGSTIQIFDSAGNPVSFNNQTGGTLDYLNNDFHQGTTSRWGDAVLNSGETYTIQIRYWENAGGDTLSATITGPDTTGTENLLTTDMIGLPPGPEYSTSGVPAGVEGNDSIDGGAGNDTISGDGGDDTLLGGADNDVIDGGTGADSIEGGTGADTITGGTGTFNDTVLGGDGNDVITTGDGNDSIDGGADADNINSGAGDDTIFGGTGNDTINAGAGANQIDAGDGDDRVFGQRYDTILGGEGNDTISSAYGLVGDSEIYGEGGNDSLIGTNGNQALYGGAGNDTITGGNDFGTFDTDTLDGGVGNDSIVSGNTVAAVDASWEARGDDMRGGAGDDTLIGGTGEDTLDGGDDDDLITGGQADDVLTGGDGFDTFFYNVGDGNDTITDFNTTTGGDITDGDQTNNDFLDLEPFYDSIFDVRDDLNDDGVLNQSTGVGAGSTALGGSITLTGVSASDLTFDNVNVACFTAGTLIDTDMGPVAVEHLTSDMRLTTMDNGFQPVRAVVSRVVPGQCRFAPVVISKGALGNDRDLVVSPAHKMLITGWRTELMFGCDEVLASAKSLINGDTIYRRPVDEVEYFHILLDQHEIIFAEGSATESYFLDSESIIDDAALELMALFPDLLDIAGTTARPVLRGYEIKALFALAA